MRVLVGPFQPRNGSILFAKANADPNAVCVVRGDKGDGSWENELEGD